MTSVTSQLWKGYNEKSKDEVQPTRGHQTFWEAAVNLANWYETDPLDSKLLDRDQAQMAWDRKGQKGRGSN